jgi:hypothetical protein
MTALGIPGAPNLNRTSFSTTKQVAKNDIASNQYSALDPMGILALACNHGFADLNAAPCVAKE